MGRSTAVHTAIAAPFPERSFFMPLFTGVRRRGILRSSRHPSNKISKMSLYRVTPILVEVYAANVALSRASCTLNGEQGGHLPTDIKATELVPAKGSKPQLNPSYRKEH